MSTAIDASAIQAIAELARQAARKPDHCGQHENGETPVLVYPDKTIVNVEHLHPRPISKRGKAVFGDPSGFGDYVNAHRTRGLVIFGEVTETGGGFTAILDGHIPATVVLNDPEKDPNLPDLPARTITDPGAPGWGEHVAELPLKPTPEWARWIGSNGKSLRQEEFAIFLEENATDVLVPPEDIKHIAGFPVPHGQLPTSAQLMSVALTLQAKTDVQFSSKINRANGQQQVTFHETISATHGGAAEQGLGIPEFFCIVVAPFRGGNPQLVLCRLRFRASGGKATFEYQIIRPHKIVEHAWKLTAQDIAAATGEDVLLGSIGIPGRKSGF